MHWRVLHFVLTVGVFNANFRKAVNLEILAEQVTRHSRQRFCKILEEMETRSIDLMKNDY